MTLTAAEYQELFNSLPDAIIVVDSEGRIVSANDLAERMFGYLQEELLGQRVEILIPETVREKHVDYRNTYVQNPKMRPMGAVELGARRKDGSIFPVEISLSPFNAPDGLRVISAIRDVSRRKQVEEALRSSEERYRLLTEEVRDYAIFMLDPEGRVMTWNEGAKRMRGYQTEEIIGRHISIFFIPEDVKAGRPAEELREAEAKGRVETEGWRVKKDGSRFWSHV